MSCVSPYCTKPRVMCSYCEAAERPLKLKTVKNKQMKLTIEIPCNDGVEMENNLNKAIADFSEALLKKGFSEMELIAYNETVESEPIYTLTLKSLAELNDIRDNKIELLKEDLECVHLYLDDKLTPRKDSYGKDYSIVGRIKFLEKYCYNSMVIKSDNICPTTNKPCDDECCPVGAVCNLNDGHENVQLSEPKVEK